MKTTYDRMHEEFLATTGVRIREEERAKSMARIREERAGTLLRLLDKRFGEVSEATRARVQGAPIEDLDRWLDRILDAPTADAVLAD